MDTHKCVIVLVILLVLVRVIYSEKIVNISRGCVLDKEWELTTDKA
tara:strand:+ start:409 stop:546 length:138 start_codon:yes stop_codon:yes gene_type:complete